MRERGCFPTTTQAQRRRPCRSRHPYAVSKTSLRCVCIQRRNCIEQSSPSPVYAPGSAHFPVGTMPQSRVQRRPPLPASIAALTSRIAWCVSYPSAPRQTSRLGADLDGQQRPVQLGSADRRSFAGDQISPMIPPIAPGVKPLHLGLAPPRGAMGPLRRRVALRQRLTFFAR
jgi:hypothetical protein